MIGSITSIYTNREFNNIYQRKAYHCLMNQPSICSSFHSFSYNRTRGQESCEKNQRSDSKNIRADAVDIFSNNICSIPELKRLITTINVLKVTQQGYDVMKYLKNIENCFDDEVIRVLLKKFNWPKKKQDKFIHDLSLWKQLKQLMNLDQLGSCAINLTNPNSSKIPVLLQDIFKNEEFDEIQQVENNFNSSKDELSQAIFRVNFQTQLEKLSISQIQQPIDENKIAESLKRWKVSEKFNACFINANKSYAREQIQYTKEYLEQNHHIFREENIDIDDEQLDDKHYSLYKQLKIKCDLEEDNWTYIDCKIQEDQKLDQEKKSMWAPQQQLRTNEQLQQCLYMSMKSLYLEALKKIKEKKIWGALYFITKMEIQYKPKINMVSDLKKKELQEIYNEAMLIWAKIQYKKKQFSGCVSLLESLKDQRFPMLRYRAQLFYLMAKAKYRKLLMQNKNNQQEEDIRKDIFKDLEKSLKIYVSIQVESKHLQDIKRMINQLKQLDQVCTTCKQVIKKRLNKSQNKKLQQQKDYSYFSQNMQKDYTDKKEINLFDIFKQPGEEIKYQNILSDFSYLRQKRHPYLNYVLRNSQKIFRMYNYYQIISFVNALRWYVENQYERRQMEKPLKQLLQTLKDEHGYDLPWILKNPQEMFENWRRITRFTGTLKIDCTSVGEMNPDYSLQTPAKAFILDQSTKENPFGLMITAIFHMFAERHNEVTSDLDSRKDLIKQYKSLKLYDKVSKINPQSMQQKDFLFITEEQLKSMLMKCSTSSFKNGHNVVFMNLEAYENYFIKKLYGKCEIITNTEEYESICYNGQAFSAHSKNSNTLSELRQKFDQKISKKGLNYLHGLISGFKVQNEEQIIFFRGDIEKIIIALNSLEGSLQAEKTIQSFQMSNKFALKSKFSKNKTFLSLPIMIMIDLYQILEVELKFYVLKRLPNKYQEKLEEQDLENIKKSLKLMPLQGPCDLSPTLLQFQDALFKFVSRNLQSGIMDNTKIIVEYLQSREDFWPVDYEDKKKQWLSQDPTLSTLSFKSIMAIFEIIQKIKSENIESKQQK